MSIWNWIFKNESKFYVLCVIVAILIAIPICSAMRTNICSAMRTNHQSNGKALCYHYERINCENAYNNNETYSCGQQKITSDCNVAMCCCYMGVCD